MIKEDGDIKRILNLKQNGIYFECLKELSVWLRPNTNQLVSIRKNLINVYLSLTSSNFARLYLIQLKNVTFNCNYWFDCLYAHHILYDVIVRPFIQTPNCAIVSSDNTMKKDLYSKESNNNKR